MADGPSSTGRAGISGGRDRHGPEALVPHLGHDRPRQADPFRSVDIIRRARLASHARQRRGGHRPLIASSPQELMRRMHSKAEERRP